MNKVIRLLGHAPNGKKALDYVQNAVDEPLKTTLDCGPIRYYQDSCGLRNNASVVKAVIASKRTDFKANMGEIRGHIAGIRYDKLFDLTYLNYDGQLCCSSHYVSPSRIGCGDLRAGYLFDHRGNSITGFGKLVEIPKALDKDHFYFLKYKSNQPQWVVPLVVDLSSSFF